MGSRQGGGRLPVACHSARSVRAGSAAHPRLRLSNAQARLSKPEDGHFRSLHRAVTWDEGGDGGGPRSQIVQPIYTVCKENEVSEYDAEKITADQIHAGEGS